MDSCQIKFKTHTDTQKEDKYGTKGKNPNDNTMHTEMKRNLKQTHKHAPSSPSSSYIMGLGVLPLWIRVIGLQLLLDQTYVIRVLCSFG